MEASNSTARSYAWKSILKGRDVIKRGARWRIGSGESVKIWNDSWLPSMNQTKIQSPMVDEFSDATVSALIRPSLNC